MITSNDIHHGKILIVDDLEANVQIFVGAEQSASLEEVVANGRESSEVKIFVLSATCGG